MPLSLTELLILLLVAGICGALGQTLGGTSLGGVLAAGAIGFVGALLGVLMARGLELPEPLALRVGEANFPVVWSVIGATVLMIGVALLRPPTVRFDD